MPWRPEPTWAWLAVEWPRRPEPWSAWRRPGSVPSLARRPEPWSAWVAATWPAVATARLAYTLPPRARKLPPLSGEDVSSISSFPRMCWRSVASVRLRAQHEPYKSCDAFALLKKRKSLHRRARYAGAAVDTILVVDDEPIVVEVVSRYLRRDGFRVVTAATGPDAERVALDT